MLKKRTDHNIKISPFCGKIIEILSNRDNPRIDIAMALDIKPTQAHYHMGFEEIYLVIDGCITVDLYDPVKDQVSKCSLEANELFVIAPGVHHKVTSSSENSRLCVICLPGFDPKDEHPSDKF